MKRKLENKKGDNQKRDRERELWKEETCAKLNREGEQKAIKRIRESVVRVSNVCVGRKRQRKGRDREEKRQNDKGKDNKNQINKEV